MIITTATLIALSAIAQTPEDNDLSLSLNVGSFSVLALPDLEHLAQFVYVGPSLLVPITDTLSLIPMANFEVATNSGTWGIQAGIIADFLVSDSIGIDAFLFFERVQDADPTIAETFFLGFGPGLTVLLPGGKSLGVCGILGYNLTDNLGWSLSPGINFAVPIP